MNTRTRRWAIALVAATCLGLGVAHGASAHDVHSFGPDTLALGWLHEPAYVGVDNAVQLLVRDARGPVTGVTGLTVDVSLGSASMNAVPLVETADPDTGLGTPGEYVAHFIPTAPGNYTFDVRGTINGTAINDRVSAGPTTFNEVQSGSAAEFPNTFPALPAIATKVDAVSGRVDAASQATAAAQSSANDARDAANRALAVSIAALLLAGGLGAANLVAGLRRGRSAA